MRKTFQVTVEFGDCDPAQIVYYPNFFRWMDAASRHFFIACGVPLFAKRVDGDRVRIQAAPVPEDMREMCGGGTK